MIDHPRAIVALSVSGSTFMTAHWFLVTEKLLHMGAEVVSIASGIAAATYYVPVVYRRVKALVAQLRSTS